MLKVGIWRVTQDTPFQHRWRQGLMAATLLASADGDRFDRLMPQICMSNGVARTTKAGRFTGFNGQVQAALLRVFPPGAPLAVEDWAVSNGTTAAEWFHRLQPDFPQARFTASDAELFLIEARRAHDAYVLEPSGAPIQYVHPPFVVSLVNFHNWLYPVNRMVQMRALRDWKRIAAQLELPDWQDLDSGPAVVVQPGFELRRLPLIHPSVFALRSEAFRIRRHSVFSPLPAPVDVIRTMNILNHAYFSEAQLRSALDAIDRSLHPGGVWIVGRTFAEDPPRHDATVYRKQAAGWELLLRIGKGSELEPLVESITQSSES